jgi:PiT family inorganic phosphate transporter
MLFLSLISLLAFYLAWNLGANDVANAMGTSVGSKAVTLRQALVIAGVLEFAGAVLFGRGVSETLTTKVANPALFADQPSAFLIGMVSVLVACGLWLQIATWKGWPVSSSHATVGAIAGFSWVAMGARSVDWQSIGVISGTWILTPLVSGTIAALLYSLVKHWILDQPHPVEQLNEWVPWLSAGLFGVFGVIVLPTLTSPLQAFLNQQFGLVLPAHDLPIIGGAIATFGLTLFSWQQLNWYQQEGTERQQIERQMGRFQVLSACFVAFAHGSNDVGNAVAPLAAIAYIDRTGSVPLAGFQVPLWVLILGGAGIVGGLAVWGKKVITTVGEGIIPLQPSSGFCAELAAATTILLASRLGLPVSTTHALVGGVVGIGIIQGFKSLQIGTIRQIGLAWLITVPIGMGLGAGIFAIARQLF